MRFNSVCKFELDINPNNLILRIYNKFRYLMFKFDNEIDKILSEISCNSSKDPNNDFSKFTECNVLSIYIVNHPIDRINEYRDYYLYINENGNMQTYQYKYILDIINEKIKSVSHWHIRDAILDAYYRNPYNGKISNTNNDIYIEKYKVGDFRKRNKLLTSLSNSYAYVIILIPSFCDDLKHEGGLLRIWDSNNEIYEFDSNKIKKITAIIFNPEFEYEITPITSGTLLLFNTIWNYDESMLKLCMSRNINGKYNLEEKKLNYDRQIGNLLGIKKYVNQDFDKMIDKLELNEQIDFNYFTNKINKYISDELTHINASNPKLDKYNLDGLIKLIKEKPKHEKFAVIRLLNFYRHDISHVYKNDLNLFNELCHHFGKVGIKNMYRRFKCNQETYNRYYNYDNEDKQITTCDDSSLCDIDNNNSISIMNTYIDIKTGFKTIDDNDNAIYNLWHTYYVIRIWNYKLIITFIGIWYLRKNECPYIGKLPKDIMKFIISKL